MADPQVIQQTQTTIPDYARQYVENMLGMAQGAIFDYKKDANGNPILDANGKPQVTGIAAYQPYTGARFAGTDPLSTQAYNAVKGMGLGPEAATSLQNMYNYAKSAGTSTYTPTAYGNQYDEPAAYKPSSFNYQSVSPTQVANYQMRQPQDVVGTLSKSAQLGKAPTAAAERMQAAQLGNAPTYQGQQLNYNPQTLGYERVAAPNLRDLQMQGARDVSTQSFTQPGARQQYMDPYMQDVVDAQLREEQRAADKAAVQSKGMRAQAGTYGGSAAALERAEADRNLNTRLSDIRAKGLQAAYQSGMGQFNTEAQSQLQAALANQQTQQQTGVQNLSAALQTQGLGAQTGLTAQQLNQAAGMQTGQFNQQQAYNTALQNAQLAQQQQLANQGLQGQYGLQQGQMSQAANAANQQAGNQIALANQALAGQYGLSQGQLNQGAMLQNAQMQQQANLANQQAGLTTGQQNLAANLGVQQLYNSQAMQAALANQQAGLTTQQQQELANQYGYGQQMTSAANAAQYGQAANQLNEQAKQFGAGYGLQGLQAGMQGMQNYGNLSGLYNQQQGNIANAQNLLGQQFQNYQQQQLTQNYNDFINQRNFPIEQLGQFSNLLRGLPLAQTTSAQYQQAPSIASQLAGFGTAAVGAANLFKAEGGMIRSPRGLPALAIAQMG
jgi:hypothetical protein